MRQIQAQDTEGNAPMLPEDRVRRIQALIETGIPQKIADVASEFKLSQSHLQHLFKRNTGVGLGHALTEQRLQKAAELLAGTSLRVKEIAAAVGYGHTSSFTRAFGQRFARSPRSFRADSRRR